MPPLAARVCCFPITPGSLTCVPFFAFVCHPCAVGWDLAPMVLQEAMADVREPRVHAFLHRYLGQIVGIFLDQAYVRRQLVHDLRARRQEARHSLNPSLRITDRPADLSR